MTWSRAWVPSQRLGWVREGKAQIQVLAFNFSEKNFHKDKVVKQVKYLLRGKEYSICG